MKTTHTPGPWTNTGHDGKQTIVVETKWGGVARVAYAGDLAQQEANARLIAAAPDLLNMLRRVMDEYLMRDPATGPICQLTLEHARAAIAKAEGNA